MEGKPLIQDSMLARWILGLVGTLGTFALGWMMTTLSNVNQTSLRIDTQMESLQTWSYNTEDQLAGISERVDTLYAELELAARAARKEIDELDDRLRVVEIELLARRDVVKKVRKEQAIKEAQVRERLLQGGDDGD